MNSLLVVVTTFENALEAEIARGRLESEGISAFIIDGHIVGANWGLSNAVGGVKLQVREVDLLKAKEILGVIQEMGEDSGWGQCPKCQSKKLEVKVDRRFPFLTWLFLGIPLLFPQKSFLCHSCGKVIKKPLSD